mmetsp:Transcript_114747/g.159308  ORF Transcript_114747/g.159308 Transcript_114747/m.159308 type:complete len:232 (+) Transcript_114747:316-1011(+)
MRVFSWVISVIRVERIASEVVQATVIPGLEFQVRNRAALVVVTNSHSTLVSLVIDELSTEGPLLLLTKTFENVVGANLHNVDLLVETGFSTLSSRALSVLLDFLNATAGDSGRHKSHVLRVLHGRLVLTTLISTQGLVLSIGVPVIVSLDVSVVLLERVIKVRVEPVTLRNNTEVPGKLRVLIRLVVISGMDRVQLLVQIVVDKLVAQVPVGLLPVVLWHVGGVEVGSCHI